MSQIINITSEALQATVRRLLPSQQGFGEDLQAVNVITPIIDLTPTAEGSQLPTFIQQALNFTQASSFAVTSGTTTLINTTGFYRVFGTGTVRNQASATETVSFQINNGLSTKDIWEMGTSASATALTNVAAFDFTVFLSAGESLEASTSSDNGYLAGSTRQVATVNGELVNPTGFEAG